MSEMTFERAAEILDLPPGVCSCDWCENRRAAAAIVRNAARIQLEIIGWLYAYACLCMDNGTDIRNVEVQTILDDCMRAIGGEVK
jgi:hypothetical protein